MEFEILNEILTTSVGALLFGNIMIKKPGGETKSPTKSRPSTESFNNNLLKQPIEQKNIKVEDQKKNQSKNMDELLDHWIMVEGPNKFQESMKKLKIDLNKIKLKEIEKMPAEFLALEKKKIKAELKHYDITFKSIFRRLPLKNEKEPMRPLYIYYKRVKEVLDEKAGSTKSSSINNNEQRNNPNNKLDKNKIEELKKKLFDLKKQKEQLKELFQRYHTEFFRNNNRKIKYVRDITPIEREYQLSRDIKDEITKIENILKDYQ